MRSPRPLWRWGIQPRDADVQSGARTMGDRKRREPDPVPRADGASRIALGPAGRACRPDQRPPTVQRHEVASMAATKARCRRPRLRLASPLDQHGQRGGRALWWREQLAPGVRVPPISSPLLGNGTPTSAELAREKFHAQFYGPLDHPGPGRFSDQSKIIFDEEGWAARPPISSCTVTTRPGDLVIPAGIQSREQPGGTGGDPASPRLRGRRSRGSPSSTTRTTTRAAWSGST